MQMDKVINLCSLIWWTKISCNCYIVDVKIVNNAIQGISCYLRQDLTQNCYYFFHQSYLLSTALEFKTFVTLSILHLGHICFILPIFI